MREAMIDSGAGAGVFFLTATPSGAKVAFGESSRCTIVGVVDQARLYDLARDGRPQVLVRAEDFASAPVLRRADDP